MAYPSSVATDADLHLAKNNLSTTLAGAINSTTDLVILTDASSFPITGFVTLESEIIQYTGISTNTLTGVTRGVDGTPQAAHADLTPVNHFVIAAHHNALKDELIATETDLVKLNFGATIGLVDLIVGGTFSPAGNKLYIESGSAGVPPTFNAGADDFIIEGSGNHGMTLLGINTSTGNIFWGDTDDAFKGAIQYNHATDQLTIVANSANAVKFDASVIARDTRLFVFDVDNGQLERVTVGVADSGGTGFKVLRIPN